MERDLASFVDETAWSNQIVLGSILPETMWTLLPHICRSWLRNYIGGTVVYLLLGAMWCLYIYYYKRGKCMLKDALPSREAILTQIKMSLKALLWYSTLPTFGEHMVEQGWTKCFSRISDVGWTSYACYMITYLVIVEFCIYWIHRELHDIKPLYKHLHTTHHKYNNQNTISPFAGLAHHPLDGIVQGSPHVLVLFLVPMHFTSHTALLFLELVWTTNIHDCIHGDLWPIMGAGYHTVHHTTNRNNYGHYTICMDWIFGTLRTPITNIRQGLVKGK